MKHIPQRNHFKMKKKKLKIIPATSFYFFREIENINILRENAIKYLINLIKTGYNSTLNNMHNSLKSW